MPDKDNLPNIDKGGQGENTERGYQSDVMKSYIPDFQHTPPTPSTPAAAQGNSGSGSQTGSPNNDE